MMNKSAILTGVIVSLLAGCSASASLATPPIAVTDTPTTHQYAFNTELFRHSNTLKMKRIVKYLESRIERTSYVFSGASPSGWDCSGMVLWAYQRFGIELPHSADKQAHLGIRVSKPKIGDIVVFAYNGSTNFYHASIYIGHNKIINANYGAGTTIIEPLSDYKGSQIRFVRLIPTD